MIPDYRDYFAFIGKGKWECRICGTGLSSKSRERHLERIHGMDTPIQNTYHKKWNRPDRNKFIEAYKRIENHRYDLEAES